MKGIYRFPLLIILLSLVILATSFRYYKMTMEVKYVLFNLPYFKTLDEATYEVKLIKLGELSKSKVNILLIEIYWFEDYINSIVRNVTIEPKVRVVFRLNDTETLPYIFHLDRSGFYTIIYSNITDVRDCILVWSNTGIDYSRFKFGVSLLIFGVILLLASFIKEKFLKKL